MDISIRQREDVIIIKPNGEIIGPASREFRDLIADQLARTPDATKLLFDFGKVSIMDSTALGVLMGTHQTVTPENGRVALVNVGSKANALIERAKLTPVFQQFESEDEAILALSNIED